MDNKTIADRLASIAQIDYDAIQAYDEAIKRIDAADAEIRSSLTLFRQDHERHVTDLQNMILSLGQQPPEMSKDIKGRMIAGMTILMSAIGTSSALKAMYQNEKLTNKTYANATTDKDFTSYPLDLQSLLKKNYADEEKHIAYIEVALNELSAEAKRK